MSNDDRKQEQQGVQPPELEQALYAVLQRVEACERALAQEGDQNEGQQKEEKSSEAGKDAEQNGRA